MEGSSDGRLSPLHPRVRTLWWCVGALAALAATVVAIVADLVVLPTPRGLVPGAVMVVAGAAAAVVPPLRYRRWRYALHRDELEIRRGVVWTMVSLIPYARLQFVDTSQGPLDRLFGLSRLVVHTAAVGTSGTLPGLDEATAADLRGRLTRNLDRDDAPV